jgi:5-methylcytosine-specific restriction protein A
VPSLTAKVCGAPGCVAVVTTPYCNAHTKARAANRESARSRPGNFRQRGYTTRWDKLRKVFLAKHPLCVACLANGRTTAANTVDHIIPHRGDQALMWSIENLQPMCAPCHSRKTASGL